MSNRNILLHENTTQQPVLTYLQKFNFKLLFRNLPHFPPPPGSSQPSSLTSPEPRKQKQEMIFLTLTAALFCPYFYIIDVFLCEMFLTLRASLSILIDHFSEFVLL